MNDEFLQPSSLDASPAAPVKSKKGKPRSSWPWILLLLLVGGLIGIRMLRPSSGHRERVEATPTAPPEPTATPDPTLRIEAEAAMEKVLADMRALRPADPSRWAAEEWTQIEAEISLADESMADQKYAEARLQYEAVLPKLKKLIARLPELPEQLMPKAFDAYREGRKVDAVALLEIILFLEPEHPQAKELLPRAENADLSFRLLTQAKTFVEKAEWDLAYAELNRLKEGDDQFPGAAELETRVREQLSHTAYKKWMTQALLAMENDDWVSAEAWVRKARDLYPDNQATKDLEQQIIDHRVQQKVLALKAEAGVLTHEEKWAEAHKKWLEMKSLDAGAPWIQEGLEQSLKWKLLSEKIRKGLADPGSDQTGLWVNEMQNREGWPANLSARADELAARWKLAVTPVTVKVTSDFETQVEISKVGRWKPFARLEVSLKPGKYVAKGIRLGYRDVRVPFEVKPGQKDLVVDVKCVEGI